MNKLNVLLVDDEPNVLKSLKRVFIDTDFRVLTAESGEEGLKVCAKEKLALVISDYRMPGMTGVQFLSRVKELHPNTIRIILSGYADVSAIVEAINDGQVYRFLSKPWNDEELLDTVRQSLDHYLLREENFALMAELQIANDGLKELTDGLECKVEERTRDLELQYRATQTAQRILNHLPAGVIGIDAQSTVVYLNSAISNFTDTQQLVFGETIEWASIKGLLIHMKTCLESKNTSKIVVEENGKRIVCTPLADRSGVIGLFSYINPDDYQIKESIAASDQEVANVD